MGAGITLKKVQLVRKIAKTSMMNAKWALIDADGDVNKALMRLAEEKHTVNRRIRDDGDVIRA